MGLAVLRVSLQVGGDPSVRRARVVHLMLWDTEILLSQAGELWQDMRAKIKTITQPVVASF